MAADSEPLKWPLTKETPTISSDPFSFLFTPTTSEPALYLNMSNLSGIMGLAESMLRTLGKRFVLRKEPALAEEPELLKKNGGRLVAETALDRIL